MSENEKKVTIQNLEWKLEKLKEKSDEISNMLKWYVEAYSLLEFEIKQLRGR